MTELSTETYILYNKTIIRRWNVLVQNGRGRNVLARNVRERYVQVQKVPWRKSLVRNVQVQKVRGETSWSKISGQNAHVQTNKGRMSWSKKARGETTWSKKSGGETSWARNARSKMSRAKLSGLIYQVTKRPAPKCLGAKRPGPKCQGVKRPGPKCQGAKRPVQTVRGRNVLVRKVSVRVRKHFLSLHFMIVTLHLWLWHSLKCLYDCEVLLLLSFEFYLWLVNWFDLCRGNMIALFNQKLSFGNDILRIINVNYKIPSPWPWPSSHGWRWGWYWEKHWTHIYHQTTYESDPSKGFEIKRCSYKVPKSVSRDVTRGRTALTLVHRFTYITIWAILWQLALVSSRKRINILLYPFLLSHHTTFQ